MEYQIRLATESDVEDVRRIYKYYVERSTCTFQIEPESISDRLRWFRSHDADHPVTFACNREQVVGWASISQWNSRCAYSRTAELSVYVHHEYHRMGIRKSLLGDLIERAKVIGHHVLIGGACTEQTGSIRLQESFGFVPVACFRQVGRKFDRWLDVAYLQLTLDNNDRT